MAKLPIIGRGVRARQRSLDEAAEAKTKSADSLREAKAIGHESKRVQESLTKILRENHFAERFGDAMRGVVDDN